MVAVPALLRSPKRTTLTAIGPKRVPNELTPPARFRRCAPVAGLPSAMANGCAAVCCNEKPNAMMKKQASTIPNVAPVPDATKAREIAPTTDIVRPRMIPFLKPILLRISTPEIEDKRYKIREPKK